MFHGNAHAQFRRMSSIKAGADRTNYVNKIGILWSARRLVVSDSLRHHQFL